MLPTSPPENSLKRLETPKTGKCGGQQCRPCCKPLTFARKQRVRSRLSARCGTLPPRSATSVRSTGEKCFKWCGQSLEEVVRCLNPLRPRTCSAGCLPTRLNRQTLTPSLTTRTTQLHGTLLLKLAGEAVYGKSKSSMMFLGSS